jgi:hypothetical protein
MLRWVGSWLLITTQVAAWIMRQSVSDDVDLAQDSDDRSFLVNHRNRGDAPLS